MSKNIDAKYKKHELRDHIYELPDTYIGSIETAPIETYVLNEDASRMEKRVVQYVPGLYKIFDEVLVNAIDQTMRLKVELQAKEDVKLVKAIKVTVDKESGRVTVENDGDGIDVEKHPTYNDVWIPEMIFGHLLTSTNYDSSDEKLWGGKNGYGAKLANIYSKEFLLETVDHRRKLVYKQKWSDNMKVVGKPTVKAFAKVPYTRIEFLPDYARFGIGKLTDDMYELFRRRVYDACATTDPSIAIYFNGKKIEVKDFEKYVDLYIGNSKDRLRAYERCNDRWEVVATYSETGQFEQVSFVNGINTLRGGKHVEFMSNQIIKRLIEMAAKKKKDVKAQHVRENMVIFVKSLIVNPSFDSQSKETLTTQSSKFGSKCELSDKFFDKCFKCGIVDRAISLTDFHDKKKMAKNDGKKTSRVLIPKLDDANMAGTKNSEQCTLILTEGDSAKSMAIAGLSVVGRDHYGVFPLRGKILNVKDALAKKIGENEEITNLKKILGLEQGRTYTDVKPLRYGKVILMTDQDEDGSHIKGLLFNVFQSLWPSLFQQNGFLNSMLTPLIKAFHGPSKREISFYKLADFEKWQETQGSAPGWTYKYYKGLGTSTAEEAKEYFRKLQIAAYDYTGAASDESIDLAFNKKRADDRKVWLMKFDRNKTLDYTNKHIPYEEFVHSDLIHFSNRDLERNIPSMCDGLKESTRKIMYACFKRKLTKREIRVAQLSGYISEITAYHHGEKSLQDAIVGMAQDFVGSNNINLLMPNGQFGTRVQGGDDAASPRYIHTLLAPLSLKIFRTEDAPILNYLNDDGQQIEPEYYIPVVPLVLINGSLGIGTGFSTNIPSYNPSDVHRLCHALIGAIQKAHPEIHARDMADINQIIDKATLPAIQPWTMGFKGKLENHKKEGTYVSKGVWKWVDDKTVEVSELPIGTWTEDYKDFLVKLITENSTVLKDFENHYTDKHVRFILKLYDGKRPALEKDGVFETEFKLASSRKLSINNMHLYSAKGAIQKYKDPQHIVREWAKVRMLKYIERKAYMMAKMEADHQLISSKVKFIKDIIEQRVHVMNRPTKDVERQLASLSYPTLAEIMKKMPKDPLAQLAELEKVGESEIEEGDAIETSSKEDDDKKRYAYLTSMPINQLTKEKKEKLEREAKDLNMSIQTLKTTQVTTMWETELAEFNGAWEAHKTAYEHDLRKIVDEAPKKRGTKK